MPSSCFREFGARLVGIKCFDVFKYECVDGQQCLQCLISCEVMGLLRVRWKVEKVEGAWS